MSADLFWLWAWFGALAVFGCAVVAVLAWTETERQRRANLRRRNNVVDLTGWRR